MAITAPTSDDFGGTAFGSVAGTVKYGEGFPGLLAGSAVLTQPTSAASKMVWSSGLAGKTTIYYREARRFRNLPAANIAIIQVKDGANLAFGVRLNTGGTLSMVDATGAPIGSATGVVPTNTWFRIEFVVNLHATAGSAMLRLYWDNGANLRGVNGLTAQETLTGTSLNTLGTVSEVSTGLLQAATGNTHDIAAMALSDEGWEGPAEWPESYTAIGGVWKPTPHAQTLGLDPTPPDPPDPPAGFTMVPKTGWVEDGKTARPVGGAGASSIRLPPHWARDRIPMKHVHLNVGLNELVTVGTTTTTANAAAFASMIQPILDWNTVNPTQQYAVHIRLHIGERAPTQWMSRCGVIEVGDVDFNKRNNIPQWWEAASPYRGLYVQAHTALAPMFESYDCIKSINNTMSAYFYPESFIFLKDDDVDPDPDVTSTNGERLLAAGFTAAKERAFKRWAAPILAPLYSRLIIYLALNPAPMPGESVADEAFMWEIADAHIDSLPTLRAGIENYSMRTSYMSGAANYQRMYEQMRLRRNRAWVNIQLARAMNTGPNPMTDTHIDELGDWCATKGFHSVETTGDDPLDKGRANKWPDAYVPFEAVLKNQHTRFVANIAATKAAAAT